MPDLTQQTASLAKENKDKKLRATSFEHRIKNFFSNMQFDDVDGASDSFMIGGIQVDVCAGHEDSLIVVECTMKRDLGEKPLRTKIKEFRGSRDAWEKGFRSHPKYSKYKNFYFILAVKNIDVTRDQIAFANDDRTRIYIADDNFIAYYEDLYDKIGLYAKYNLLGEIGIKPKQQNTLQIPASMVMYGKSQMYLLFIQPKVLLEVSYVARREARNERFYQRLIDKSRLGKISEYVKKGGVLPNNLIIAFGEEVKKFVKFHETTGSFGIKQQLEQYGVKHGILEFPRNYRSCWIIDGQHRLYSFTKNDIMMSMPVVAFKDLDLEKQGKIFLDINKNQKPVPSDLVWDLNGDMIRTEPDGIISNVVKTLNASGPLHYQILIPSKGIKRKSGLLKIGGLCIALKRAGLARENTSSKTMNPFYSKDPDDFVKKLSHGLTLYFYTIKDLFTDNWGMEDKGFVRADGGASVFIKLFEKIVSRLVEKGIPSAVDYKKYLAPIRAGFPSPELVKLRVLTSSEGGKDELLRKFVVCIRESTGDAAFGGAIQLPGAKEITSLERRLKEYIKFKLKATDESDDWLADKLAPEVYGKLLKLAKKNNASETDLHLQLTFGECFQLIRMNKDSIYGDFVGKESHKFHSDQDFEAGVGVITRTRNTKQMHEVGVSKRSYDDDLFRIYLEKINECLDEVGFDDEGSEDGEGSSIESDE